MVRALSLLVHPEVEEPMTIPHPSGDEPLPNPGSDAAINQGCRCPVLDNAHGRGAWGSEGPEAFFWTSKLCPLHNAEGA